MNAKSQPGKDNFTRNLVIGVVLGVVLIMLVPTVISKQTKTSAKIPANVSAERGYGIVFNGAWNFGPNDHDARPVSEVIDLLIEHWNGYATWEQDKEPAPHEANFLRLDCSKAKQKLGWNARWSLESAIKAIVHWQEEFRGGGDVLTVMHQQINHFNHSSLNY
jgi:hypothetical protein